MCVLKRRLRDEGMVQRVSDGQRMLRDDNRNLRRRLSRIEGAILGLQRAALDRAEETGETQEQIDALAERIAKPEGRP